MATEHVLIGLIGLTIFVGYLSSVFFDKTKIPDVLLLILMGMILGPVTNIINGTLLIELAPLIGTIALIIIVFDGSTKLNFFEVLDELPESMWFTLLVCILTAASVAIAYLLTWADATLIQGLLLGIVVAGTSYEIIVPLVAKLTVKDKVKTLLNLESALNDVITIVALVVLLSYISPSIQTKVNPIQFFISTFSIAIFLGIISGIFWVKVLQNYKGKPFEYLLTLAFVFLLFSVTQAFDGNGITAVLVFGLLLGNSDAIARLLKIKEELGLDPAITRFNAEISFFVRTMFFVYMGIVFIVDQNDLLPLLIGAFVVFLAVLIARIVAVKVLVRMNPSIGDSEIIIMAMLPRGLATAVLASLPLTYKVDFPAIVQIVLVFMLITNIFATIAAYYFETQVAHPSKTQVPAPAKEKKE